MIIDSYAVNTQAQRSYVKSEGASANVTLWGGGQALNATFVSGDIEVQLSEEATRMLADSREESRKSAMEEQAAARRASISRFQGLKVPQNKEELKLQMLESLLYSLTGRRMNPVLRELLGGRTSTEPQNRPGFNFTSSGSQVGGRIELQQYEYESESISYQAQGVIKTADGKTINVGVGLSMSREFMQYSSISAEFGAAMQQKAVDPLVINYGGSAASLTGEKYQFDLDMDGNLDSISFAGAGSGFLALDKNGDGTINNGSELFGPNTGSGFGELRGYDKDGNNWIDEADEVFKHLRIWSKDADGNDQLFTLQELGIGAIYLGDTATEFSMKDSSNNTNGVMRSTSFFLRENGSAGTISHIDLTV